MKKLLLAFCITIATALCAQDKDSITLKDLEIPTSPAFSILDIGSTSIERPESTKAFSLNVINALVESQGVPKNYAVEFTPYWFWKKPKMTFNRYHGYDSISNKKHLLSNMKKISFSMALISTTDSLTNLPENKFSIGIRANIIEVRKPKYADNIIRSEKLLFEQLKQCSKENITKHFALLNDEFEIDKDSIQRILDNCESGRTEELEKAKLLNIVDENPLFAIDGALAYNTSFDNNDYSSHRFGRSGAWLTSSLSLNLWPKKEKYGYLNILILTRWINDHLELSDAGSPLEKSFFDLGGKIEFEWKVFNLGFEYISRKEEGQDKNVRTSGIIKYKISDQVYLEGSFGNNFNQTNDLISILGVKWGLNSGNEELKIDSLGKN